MSGVADGDVLATAPVTVGFEVRDAHLATAEAWLDGSAVNPATGCGSTYLEGEHVFHVRATDVAGNLAERTVSFALDWTPPAVAGVGLGRSSTRCR